MIACPRCASPIADDAVRFCPFCGASLPERQPSDAGGFTPPGPAFEDPTPMASSRAPSGARCALHAQNPAIDICSRCGNFVCRECLVVSATGAPHCAACQARGEVDSWRVPWEERSKIGLFGGYWQTSKAVMMTPAESFKRMPPVTGRWWDPLSYAMLSSVLGVSGTMVVYLLIFGIGGVAAIADTGFKAGGLGAGAMVGIFIGVVVALFVGVPIATLATVFIWTGIEHLMLMLVGAQPKSFEATLRGACYSHAPCVLGLIPFCGAYAYPIWQLVCRIFAYAGVHRTTGGRSAAAVLLPIGVCCVGIVAIYAVIIGAAFAAGAVSGN